jgi:endonuclease G
VEVQTPGATTSGTGFLISPDLFITNQHVINDAGGAAHANVIFDDEIDQQGNPDQRTIYRLLPERLAIFSDENDLDYAVIAIGASDASAGIVDWAIPVSFSPDRHRVEMNV